MIYFRSDYSIGAHPKVMEALTATNMEHSDGYGLDSHCDHVREMVRELIGVRDCHVHMMIGGTPCNITVISAALRPYEAVVSPRTGHVYVHETGAAEATGHRVIAVNGDNGKLTPSGIDEAWLEYEDEHTVVPKLAYISNPTENGSIYSKAELKALSDKCRERNMYLYMDGARLGCALTCEDNDLTLRDIGELTDAFYIGGTKNGALFGEVLVILNHEMNDHFRWMIKRSCGLLAKGRLLGVQFEALLDGGEDSIYFKMGAHSNAMAKKLREGIAAKGYGFDGVSQTNQLFPVLPAEKVEELEKNFFFYRWAPEKEGKVVIRLVTSWGTTEEEVDAFIEAL